MKNEIISLVILLWTAHIEVWAFLLFGAYAMPLQVLIVILSACWYAHLKTFGRGEQIQRPSYINNPGDSATVFDFPLMIIRADKE